MYTETDLKEKATVIDEKIKNTKITNEVFEEIEKEIRAMIKEGYPKAEDQILYHVAMANNQIMLQKKIVSTGNALYSRLKYKQLEDSGVDWSNLSPSEEMHYAHIVNVALDPGSIPRKVVIKQTYR